MGAIHFSLDTGLVKVLKSQLDLSIFVETGTFKGDTVASLEKHFKKIVSIELSKTLWSSAKKRFKECSNIEIILGNSADKLNSLKSDLTSKGVLYWLDAHWCEDEKSSGKSSECPLLKELNAIETLNENSVILIDDARLFLTPPPTPHDITHWPTLNELLFELKKLNSNNELMILDDVIAFFPKRIKSSISKFAQKNVTDILLYRHLMEEQLLAERKNSKLQSASLKDLRKKGSELREKVKDLNKTGKILRNKVKDLNETGKILRNKVKYLNNTGKKLRQQISEKEKAVKMLTAQSEEKEQVIANLLKAEKDKLILTSDKTSDSKPYKKIIQFKTPWIITRVGEIFKPRLGNLRQYIPRELTKLKPVELIPNNTLSFAIVTPSYEQGTFIARTIESVVEQKYPLYEYFIQDGDSSDQTVQIIKNYKEQITGWNVKVDNGQSQAINRGFSQINGDIMCWLNSDDLLLPGALNTVSNYFYENPDIDVVYGNRLQIDLNDREIGRWILPAHDEKVLLVADFIPQETLFWRRRIWEKIGSNIDESYNFAMDWDLILRFKEAGAKFKHIHRFLGAFRVHKQQKTSSSINEIGKKEMDRIRKRTLGRIPTNKYIKRKIFIYLLKHLIVDIVYRIQSRLGI